MDGSIRTINFLYPRNRFREGHATVHRIGEDVHGESTSVVVEDGADESRVIGRFSLRDGEVDARKYSSVPALSRGDIVVIADPLRVDNLILIGNDVEEILPLPGELVAAL